MREQITSERRRQPRPSCPICRKSLQGAGVVVSKTLTITTYKHLDGSVCQRQRSTQQIGPKNPQERPPDVT